MGCELSGADISGLFLKSGSLPAQKRSDSSEPDVFVLKRAEHICVGVEEKGTEEGNVTD